MEKDVKELYGNIERAINELPFIVEPCKFCKHKTTNYNPKCSGCCYFYASHFAYNTNNENNER